MLLMQVLQLKAAKEMFEDRKQMIYEEKLLIEQRNEELKKEMISKDEQLKKKL